MEYMFEDINLLYHELVPDRGKADTMAGEIVRATCRIGVKFFKNGDIIGIDTGKTTCNAPARFLMNNTNEDIREVVRQMWGMTNTRRYRIKIEELVLLVVDYIEENESLRKMPSVDMLSYMRDGDYNLDLWDDDKDEDDIWDDDEDEE